jgi:hypothetical protein
LFTTLVGSHRLAAITLSHMLTSASTAVTPRPAKARPQDQVQTWAMPMSDTFSRMAIITVVARRDRFTAEQKRAVHEISLISLPHVIAARSNIPGTNVRPRFTPWPAFARLNRRQPLFTDHCPIWHARGWMAFGLEAIVFVLPPGDTVAISIAMEVLTAAAQRERWRDRQRQGGRENDGTQ